MAIVKLTQTFTDRVPCTTLGTAWYHDKELRGFALAVGMSCKTFYASAEVRGRLMRRKVVRSDVFTAAQARNIAKDMLADLRRGIDTRKPVGETLADALEAYLDLQRLKASTIAQYRYAFDRYLSGWQRRLVTEITMAGCDARHRQIKRRAPYAANQAFRVLKAVLRDACKRGVLIANPCDAVSFCPEARRQTRPGDKLPQWWAATEALSPIRRAAMRVILFTGFRKMEVCRLRWDDVDLEAGTVLLRDRKRGPDITLPLSRQAAALLRDVRPVAEQVRPGYCFPSAYGRSKHITEPNDASVPNTTHDLRREWLSTAAELGISLLLAKAAIGHSLGADVTEGYMVGLDVRGTVQKVADELERRALEQLSIAAE